MYILIHHRIYEEVSSEKRGFSTTMGLFNERERQRQSLLSQMRERVRIADFADAKRVRVRALIRGAENESQSHTVKVTGGPDARPTFDS
jgi:hypothetical protein